MTPSAAYDEVADWYEEVFLRRNPPDSGTPGGDPIGIDRALVDLLGRGSGACLEIGCGTGIHAARIRGLGWAPVGVDLSAGMLRHAGGRLPVARADAERLPIRDGSVSAVTAVMVHTDMPGYPAVLREVSRVLRPGGFVQFSVAHPATSTPVRRWVSDESGNRQALAIGDYFFQGPVTETWSFRTAPSRLRARHRPFTITYARRTLAGWLTAVLAAGLTIEAIAEPHADEATAKVHPQVADTRIAPYFLTVRARKPAR